MSNLPREIKPGAIWAIDQPCAERLGISENDRWSVEVLRSTDDGQFEIEAGGKTFTIARKNFYYPRGHRFNLTGRPPEKSAKAGTNEGPSYWFVGASWDNGDQTSRFVAEGIWENGYEDKYLDLVRSMKPGERIAIKSTYTCKNDLPFDNKGNAVSAMAIKATGTITENLGNGRQVKVEWTPADPPAKWYFYTYQKTVWRVFPGNWASNALIAFAFDAEPQEIDTFRNHPYWKDRFGDDTSKKPDFGWIPFYEAFANKLLQFKDNRAPLVQGIQEIVSKVDGLSIPQDQYKDGTSGDRKDICPFTTIGIFNRGIKDANRIFIAAELAKFLGVEETVPDSFEGIPILNNLNSWFFDYEKDRGADDIDALWRVFAAALRFADSDDDDSIFLKTFDDALSRRNVSWNLTTGLFWIRPRYFATLDNCSRNYITGKLKLPIRLSGSKRICNAADYLALIDSLDARFKEETCPVHSFPELSLAAWSSKDGAEAEKDESEEPSPEEPVVAALEPYSIDNILAEGCFLEREFVESLKERLRTKKNLILQGPPGTGKTWLAKRLAYALIGYRDPGKVRAVQFHPNLSYEDFVRGWRPCGDGKLALVDGPFLEVIEAAKKAAGIPYAVVIEEINRGNPAQIFGEMLTLMEADKRNPREALELSYRRTDGERVFIPENLYVIGTMNIADRSLALVDLALRRRFAFVDLEPNLGKAWQSWSAKRVSADDLDFLNEIRNRMLSLNEQIAKDTTLGRQFQIGHSFVTPQDGSMIADARDWFRQIVETEIGPLLDEYWFDATEKARDARKCLLQGL